MRTIVEPYEYRHPARTPTRGRTHNMQKSRVKRVGALLVGLTLVAAACGSDDDASTSTEAPAGTEAVVGDDRGHRRRPKQRPRHRGAGTTERSRGSRVRQRPERCHRWRPGRLPGTTPFGQITPEFIDRLLRGRSRHSPTSTTPPRPTTPIMIIGARRRSRPGPTASRTPRRSTASPATARSAPRSPTALRSIEAGTDIDYDGISGPLTFAGNGEPIVASYGKLVMGDNNRIDDQPDRVHHGRRPADARCPAGARRGQPRG